MGVGKGVKQWEKHGEVNSGSKNAVNYCGQDWELNSGSKQGY